ncbi:MAG TPA: N,N-dimethylformamidase beta subunit family domain-containing protein [Acidimicrobiia bacterium]|nr:N,N-dimethylformamidase beta subunit family domain-containing protein [Acidimicrobiia bacterium]
MTSPIVMAYADRRSVRPGETIGFKVSCDGVPTVEAAVGRLRAPNVGPGPDVPAFDFEVLDSAVGGEYPAVRQPIDRGSYVRVPPSAALADVDAFTWGVTLHPSHELASVQTVVGTASAGGGHCRLVLVGGRLWLNHSSDGSKPVLVDSGLAVPAGRWSFVSVSCDDRQLEFGVWTMPSARYEPAGWAWSVQPSQAGLRFGEGPVVVAADLVVDERGRQVPRDCFNGRIERPRLFGRPLDREEVEAVAELGPTRNADSAIGDWDFSNGISGEAVFDASASGLHGEVCNLPTRAVGGSNWSGASADWTVRSEEYGAIHFHDDDLLDADWDTSIELVVPEDWPSGCYAGRFTAGDAVFWVPFVVRAAAARSEVVFVLPTATYAAYANLRMRVTAQVVELMQGRLTVLDDTDLLLLDQPLGLSTYDTHSDGSTVVHATLRQPVTNFRPEGRIYKFCQDMLIVAWLEQTGVSYDVVTDEDIDRGGISALAGYRVVLTGSHPEYVSTKMLDAVDEHVRSGGRLMYIGGNGFYARIAFHPGIHGVVEVRRPDAPMLWAADAAQGHLAFTGEMAGTWSGLGRAPHLLTGVGFITQGFDESAGYRRRTGDGRDSDERTAFVFEGVPDDVIGDFGLLMNGAAGYEIDRADPGLGTPSHAVVLASSEGHSNIFDLALTSIADRLPVAHDAPDRIRADMVFFETDDGGAVFSVGSIAWSGSLAHNRYENNVARVTQNVLERFADPKPFLLPQSPRPT